MASSTVENYLKQIYLEQQSAPDQLVPMGKLASAMGVVPGTAEHLVVAVVPYVDVAITVDCDSNRTGE